LYRYVAVLRPSQFGGTVTCTDGTDANSVDDASVVFQAGLALFTTLFCSQNTLN
jgi:hypothetical protein